MGLKQQSERLKIVTFSDVAERRDLVLDKPGLKSILKTVENVPLAIVCVTSRENPAITDLLRACFRANATKTESSPEDNGIKVDKSMEDSEPGIWINTEPFIVEVSGDNIGILFLEVRGKPVDSSSDEPDKQWAQLLGLSLLISSHVILPASKFIQEMMLTAIKNSCPNIDEVEKGAFMFQNLFFLTYDWLMIVKHEHGSKGGDQMLRTKLDIQERQSDSAKKIRQTIQDTFEHLRGFLLPSSGQVIKDGVITFDQACVELMDRFVLENLDTQKMQPKHFNKLQISGDKFCNFVQNCIDCVNNRGSPPLHEAILAISAAIEKREELEPEVLQASDSESEVNNASAEEDNHEASENNVSYMEENPVLDEISKNNSSEKEENLPNPEENTKMVLGNLIAKIYSDCCESQPEFPATVEDANKMADKARDLAMESYRLNISSLGIENSDLLAEYKENLEKLITDYYDDFKPKPKPRPKKDIPSLDEKFPEDLKESQKGKVVQTSEDKVGLNIQENSQGQGQAEGADVEGIILWLKNKMPATVEFMNEQEINRLHENLSAAAVQIFTDRNKMMPRETFDGLLAELNKKMGNLNIETIAEFKTIEKSYEKACTESFHLYEGNMASIFEKSDILADEVFNTKNNQALSNAEDNYEKYNHAVDSKRLYHAYHERLQEKLKHSSQENRHRNFAGFSQIMASIQDRKAVCLAQYDAKLKNAFKTTNNEAGLLQLHQATKNEVEQSFQQYNSGRNPELWQKEFDSLTQGIQVSYESILDYCGLKWTQQQRIFETALNKATEFYNNQMRANAFEVKFIDPTELNEMHNKATTIALNQCSDMFKNPPLNDNQKMEIAEALKVVFKAYENKNLMNLPTDPAVGIDLGTTYSCVAVFNKIKGAVEVITNRNSGLKTTPSYVAYKNGIATVGEAAKEQAPDNPENTVFDAKRMIGRRFDDPILQKDMKFWPFKVIEENQSPKIDIEGKTYFPEQIAGKVLQEMKGIAEQYLGCKVEKAVITVPAYFNDGQRQATIDAGEIAGLKVLKIINEPTAAAIAYKIEHSDAAKRNVLIYDLGGGTFDVAILNCVQTQIDVVVVDGDTHLGGVDFDSNMSDYCCEEFKKQTGIDLLEGRDSTNANKRANASRILTRLKYACERSKKILSTKPSGEDLIRIDSVVNGVDLHVPVTKELFETINKDLFEKTINIVHRALETANLKPSEIDDIVLIGGSTRIPKVQQLLSEHFGGKALTFKIHPDEAVAVGAAFQAAMTNGQITKESVFYHETSDVTPFSIGVELYNKDLSVIIPKNTRVPHKHKELYQTVKDNQTSVTISVFQGENKIAADNMPLGKFDLEGIPKGKKGKQHIEVEIEIDPQGVLHVKAKCTSVGQGKTGLSIMGQKWRMSKEAIQKIIVRDSVMAKMSK